LKNGERNEPVLFITTAILAVTGNKNQKKEKAMKVTLKSGTVVEGRNLLVVEVDGRVEVREANIVVVAKVIDPGDLRKTLAMDISELGLSTRARIVLEKAKITTVGQLAEKSEHDVRMIRNCGSKSMQEFKDALEARGLHLGMTDID